MAKTKKDGLNTPQLAMFSMEELDDQLNKSPGELIKLPISPEDVGGELLAVLSRGLYTNPLDCIREYVQNAVDARANNSTIKITGNSVIIFDDGNGMNLAELVQARQFGLSSKSLHSSVGFRGIGIYSGFDLCRRLEITSKKAGDQNLHILVFDFAAMRAQLDADRKNGKEKTSLFDLLSEHTSIGREPLPSGRSAEDHFTVIELQDIENFHIRDLSNRASMRSYLLKNLPIDFADGFEHRKIINEKLYAYVPGYNAIKISLQSDGIVDEVVTREAITHLQPPTYGYIVNTMGQQVAYYWACLNSERNRIDNNRLKTENKDKDKLVEGQISYEGFVFKIKGFAIGNRQRLREFFNKPQLYPWYTGEIFVLDTNVVPNAERNDFEANNAKQSLMLATKDKISDLEETAETFQAQGVANERLEKYKLEVEGIKKQVTGNIQESDLDTYSRLSTILTDLRRQSLRVASDKKQEADAVVKAAEAIQRQLRKAIDNPKLESVRKGRAARNEKVEGRAPVPAVVPPVPVPAKTIQEVLHDAGFQVEGDMQRLSEAFQGSLEDVLIMGSPTYRSIITDLEARFSNGLADE